MATNVPHEPETSGKPEYGKPEKFTTLSDILRYRSITVLLAMTNFVDQRFPGEVIPGGMRRDYAHNINDSSALSWKKHMYQKLAASADVVCRDSEIVTMTLGQDNVVLGSVDEDFDDDDQVVLDMHNSDISERDRLSKAPPTQSSLQPLYPSNWTPDNAIIESPGLFFLQKTVGSESGKKRDMISKTDFSFGEHGDMFLKLLKQTYSLDDSKRNRYNLALEIYVFVNSSAAILGRLHNSTADRRKFAEYMTLSKETILDTLARSRNTSAQLSNHSSNIPLNAKECRAIQMQLELFSLLNTDIGPLKEWESAFDTNQPIMYDADGIFLYQHLLALVMKAVFDSMHALHECKTKHQTRYVEDVEVRHKPLLVKEMGREIDKAARKAAMSMRMMTFMKDRNRLGNVLEKHLNWLSQLFSERETTSDLHNTPQRAAEMNFSNDSLRAEDKYNNGIGTDLAQLNWGAAAIEFLDLSCLHICGISELARGFGNNFDPSVRAFVNTAKFKWVRHQQEHTDTKLTPLSAVLKSLKQTNHNGTKTSFDPNDIEDTIKPVIENHNPACFNTCKDYWDAEDIFSGKSHSEALMMSYADLKKNRDHVAIPSEEGTKPKQDYIRPPDRAITDQFNDTIKFLPVTKRCCPTCTAFIEYMENKQRYEIMQRFSGRNTGPKAVSLVD
ncbi:hypothetical protein C7974DRAFT_424404 [Boeremia exigua]|uniref:uncharacterized protein n=1 Tax=Boeremia exigua TaxID=749465 RepID=UPI001E8D1C37|nr:uncharacterized protein C7974DRAFT_424404 [Boeremia exigua]KAH6629346.1 hypothetical protein C7974DRAFT_424404 [Boeremia exigua]